AAAAIGTSGGAGVEIGAHAGGDSPVRALWVLVMALLAGGGCGSAPLQRFEFTRLCMGVQTNIITWAPDREPASQAAAHACALIGSDAIILDESARTVQLLRPGVRLDLGGIAKGFAAQRALESMREAGLPRSLVSLAGDIAAGDPPPGQPGWRVALEGERS